MGLALIVHGGAGAMAPDRFDAAREGCRAATAAGWAVLLAGGSAVAAVEAAIVALENNPGFNAGTGAVLTTDGRAQLDAGLMDGKSLAVDTWGIDSYTENSRPEPDQVAPPRRILGFRIQVD